MNHRILSLLLDGVLWKKNIQNGEKHVWIILDKDSHTARLEFLLN